MTTVKSRAELQGHKAKLASSYNELLDEFSSKELRTVGNYALGRLIGKGSFGKVYLASHKLTNGSKVVLKSAEKNDSNLAREIHHHRQFLHPHIARLYEVIVTEHLVWLVLEYCPGDELYNYLLKNGSLPVEKVQKIFAQLVGAVSYVHGMSCVHRDLKLENILLDKNENVKLCDFGFTREYEGKASYLQTFCGTVCYSAPEMLKGEKYAGEKVDVWSLGVILYALLTGELPFDDDDDNETKRRILTGEPKWPAHLTDDAKGLMVQLLSKRPLLRPSLADILAHPFLAEHAPNQQAILKLHQPPAFTTKTEKETLERMKSAGVDIDMVIENVLAQRCDSLAGWWALLLEKEERKEKRREKKRKEKEAENRNSRRLSAASSRLERLAPMLREVDEEGEQLAVIGPPPTSRGRGERRGTPSVFPELPRLPEIRKMESGSPTPPPPIDKDSIRSVSSSRQRPSLPPKDRRRSRNSTLQLMAANSDLLSPNQYGKRRVRRKHQHPILNQLASIKHWLIDSAKRARSPGSRGPSNASTADVTPKKTPPGVQSTREQSKEMKSISRDISPHSSRTPSKALRPQPLKSMPRNRTSISPSPMTPRSSFRRSSAGLRGRKSTSSSVSSIRSIHHRHTHSKASSTSSNSITSSANKSAARSPRNSIKVLPATPTTSAFPSNIRVVRAGTSSGNAFNETSGFGLQSPGLLFAKRKKSPFKGPTLNVGTSFTNLPTRRDSSAARPPSTKGRQSGEIIKEEDEDEVEEVDGFSPVVGPGEIEERLEPHNLT